jgi:hypothetical protein
MKRPRGPGDALADHFGLFIDENAHIAAAYKRRWRQASDESESNVRPLDRRQTAVCNFSSKENAATVRTSQNQLMVSESFIV